MLQGFSRPAKPKPVPIKINHVNGTILQIYLVCLWTSQIYVKVSVELTSKIISKILNTKLMMPMLNINEVTQKQDGQGCISRYVIMEK